MKNMENYIGMVGKTVKKRSKFSYAVFKVVRFLVRVFYGKAEVIGLENLPDHNAILVGNHSQMNGPIVGELFLPKNCYIWCVGQMMHRKEVPEYAYQDFWSHKPKWVRPFYKVLSHLMAPLASCLLGNARTIAVYRDNRIITTFKETVAMMKSGNNVLIFAENEKPHNNIVNEFNENFIDVAKLYYKKTGEEVQFVPLYVAPALRKLYIGKGIQFDSQKPIDSERKRIAAYLSDEITKIARALPEHRVVPFLNIPKKNYLTNKDVTSVPEIDE